MGNSVEQSVKNIGRLGRTGMVHVDREILNMMLEATGSQKHGSYLRE
ncbi:MAG: hypothetical protein AB1497_11715 [Bacillota bacterium]